MEQIEGICARGAKNRTFREGSEDLLDSVYYPQSSCTG